MNVEGPPVKAVATGGQEQAYTLKAVLECVRSSAPPLPEGHATRTANSMRITFGIQGNAPSSEG